MVPYEQMEEFTLEAFKKQTEDDISKTFFCHANQVKEIKNQLDAASIPVWVGLGSRPEIVSSMNFCPKSEKTEGAKRHDVKKKVQIRIKVVPYNADVLNQYCIRFKELNTDAKLIYHGESTPVVFMNALKWRCCSRRIDPKPQQRAAILAKQENKCAICTDPLDSHY